MARLTDRQAYDEANIVKQMFTSYKQTRQTNRLTNRPTNRLTRQMHTDRQGRQTRHTTGHTKQWTESGTCDIHSKSESKYIVFLPSVARWILFP